MIGITQKLFAGVVGPGSDATIVLTTLLVVAAFDPVKKRLQAIVDRRFHQRPDPATALGVLIEELRNAPSELSVDRTLRRLLAVSMASFEAEGGDVVLTDDAGTRHFAAGNRGLPDVSVMSASAGSAAATIRLYGPTHGASDADVLGRALASVLAELSGSPVAAAGDPTAARAAPESAEVAASRPADPVRSTAMAR